MEWNAAALEPAKEYISHLKEEHRKNAEALFRELAERAGVDTAANAKTQASIARERAHLAAVNGKGATYRGLRVFLIIMSVLLGLAAIILPFALNGVLSYVLPIVFALLMVGLILLTVLCVNKVIRSADRLADELSAKIGELEREAWRQMRPLNSLFEWSMAESLVTKTFPYISFDAIFDAAKYRYFADAAGLDFFLGPTETVTGLRSGVSGGNPFILLRYLGQRMTMRTYTGSRTVTWTERQGQETVTRSEVLFAHAVHPVPDYYTNSALFYWNDAAPDLNFSRTPQVTTRDEKKIEKKVEKGEKRLQKLARKAAKEGKSYTQLENSEFEVLFGATDRNDELQFRLMYTPLAQQNTVDLIKGEAGFGDDFRYRKCGRVNIVSCAHDVHDVMPDPASFTGSSFEEVKRRFLSFQEAYFKEIYFDFAPVLSVPLFLQQKPARDFANESAEFELVDWLCEELANRFPEGFFAPSGCAERLILKAHGEGEGRVRVTAHSFLTEPRVDHIPVLCSNGRFYDVPVCWTEYIPVTATNAFTVEKRTELSRSDLAEGGKGDLLDQAIFVNGLIAKIVG